jgi:uncharacterized protein YybS (DUF2232 family)
MSSGPARTLAEVVALCLASLTLMLVGAAIPVGGPLVAVMTPLPLILLSARCGRGLAVAGMVAVGAGLVLLAGHRVAWIFVMEFALPAMVLAEAVRRDWAPEISVAAGSSAIIVGSVLAVVALSLGNGGLIDNLLERLDRAVHDATVLYAKLRLPSEDGGQLGTPAEPVGAAVRAVLPGLMISAAVLIASANYFTARIGLVRAFGARPTEPGYAWKLPDWLVWGVIGAGALLLSGVPVAGQIGLNALIVMMTFYLLQGVAIAVFWIRRLKLPAFVGVLGVILLLIQPLLLLVVTGVGLFDVWFPFRRETLSRPPGA